MVIGVRTAVASARGLGVDWEGAQGTSCGDGHILDLDRDVGYMGECICQNLLNCKPEIYAFHFM